MDGKVEPKRSNWARFMCCLFIFFAVVAAILFPVYFLYVLPHQNVNAVTSPQGGGDGNSNGNNNGGTSGTAANGTSSKIPSVPGIQPPLITVVDSFADTASPNTQTPPLTQDFQFGKEPIRGVNIGGWLVLEPFITPSMFQPYISQGVVDEYTLTKLLGPQQAYSYLDKHYSTFFTEDDFKQIASYGLNYVRIPVGFWALGNLTSDEPYVPNLSWSYLLRGLSWARKYGLRAIVELHGAPGSQNGWNHSGRAGIIGWLNGTASGQANAQRTLDYLREFALFFSTPEYEHVVPLFGVLNEPFVAGIENLNSGQNVVATWYTDAYNLIRSITGNGPGKGPYLIFHDGFIGLNKWSGFLPGADRVVMDTHDYVIFDPNLIKMSQTQLLAYPCNTWKPAIATSMTSFGPTMVGEFSVATTDCAQYLNGIGIGSRYDGTFDTTPAPCATCTCVGVENVSTFSQDKKQFLLQFAEIQMDAFESSGWGWFYWTWKTEGNVDWDYLAGVTNGWLPKDPSARTYSCASAPAA